MSTATTTATSWAMANHDHLVAEFARLKLALGLECAPVRADLAAETDCVSAIDHVANLFDLTSFERDLLLLCAGVEMDSDIANRCAELQGMAQRASVTFALAMSVLDNAHWSAFTPARPLRRFGLLQVNSNGGLMSAPVRIDERMLHYLAGINVIEPALQSLVTAVPYTDLIASGHASIAHSISELLRTCAPVAPLVHLTGDDSLGHEDVAALASRSLGLQLFAVRADDLPSSTSELERLVLLLEREALLFPAAVLVQCGRSELSPAAAFLAEKLSSAVFLSTHQPVRLRRAFARFDVCKPAPDAQEQLWRNALGEAATGFNGTVTALAQQFRLSARTIANTSALAIAEEHDGTPHGVWDMCRSLARPKLEDLAHRISPVADWDDLVLPKLQVGVLRQIAAQVSHRNQVHEEWGFSGQGGRGLGVSALFCGESGTGKTLAAEVIAHELRLDLYRIDLASVVSKYIGETEKNLKTIFDAAEEGGVILLFDEADALFGKRSEVKDSHDRYANLEVGYLLQRIETFTGLAILTTNLKSALDRAFQRRIRFIVTFPFPDSTEREAIWSKVFPSRTPLDGVDIRRLAQLNVAGGNIRNIALNAAFIAADAGTSVQMRHLREAALLEAQKIERPLAEAELRGWV